MWTLWQGRRGGFQKSILLHKPYIAKWSTKGGGRVLNVQKLYTWFMDVPILHAGRQWNVVVAKWFFEIHVKGHTETTWIILLRKPYLVKVSIKSRFHILRYAYGYLYDKRFVKNSNQKKKSIELQICKFFKKRIFLFSFLSLHMR